MIVSHHVQDLSRIVQSNHAEKQNGVARLSWTENGDFGGFKVAGVRRRTLHGNLAMLEY